MSERQRPAVAESGFTLLEVLVAIGVLVVGVTSLLGLLQFGVTTRRGAELRARAALVAEQVLHDVEQRFLAEAGPDPDWGEFPLAEQIEIAPVTVEEVPGQPDLRYTVTYVTDPDRAELVLVKVRIGWLEQGEEIGEEFSRILARQVPFSDRVRARQELERSDR